MYNAKEHWEDVWTRKKNLMKLVSRRTNTLLDLILSTNPSKDAKIIDVVGGNSKLVDKLLELIFKNITVVDISAKALKRAKERFEKKQTG